MTIAQWRQAPQSSQVALGRSSSPSTPPEPFGLRAELHPHGELVADGVRHLAEIPGSFSSTRRASTQLGIRKPGGTPNRNMFRLYRRRICHCAEEPLVFAPARG